MANIGNHFKPNREVFDKAIPFLPIYLFFVLKRLVYFLMKLKLNRIRGVQVAKGAPTINHLVFDDDNLLFCQANKKEWSQIQALLEVYVAASGQVLNQQKTSIFFSANTSRTRRDQILTVAEVPEC